MLERIPVASGGSEREPGLYRDEPDRIADVGGFLACYRRLIAGAGLAGLLAGLVYVALATPMYTANAQLMLDPAMIQPMSRGVGEVALAMDTPQIESQIAVLRSERIIKAVIDKLGLLNDPEFIDGSSRLWGGSTEYERERAAIRVIQSRLAVSRVGLSYAIAISFSSPDPVKAASVANAIAEAYAQEQIDARGAAARQGSEWLETRIDNLRTQMNQAALAVQQFKAKRDYRIPPRRETVDGEQKAPGVEPEPPPGADKKTLEELEATAKTYRQIYESWLQAYTELVQRQTFSGSSTRVITPATRPLTKSHPRTGLIVLSGLLLGLAAGVGASFASQMMRPVVLSPRQVRETGLRCLAVLPNPPVHARPKTSPVVAGLQLLGRGLGIGGSNPAHARPDLSVVLNAPESSLAEAIGSVRSGIGLASMGRPIPTLGVTSVAANPAKSVLVTNLALLNAAAGGGTLIIDGNIYGPALTRALAPDCASGLLEVLAGKVQAESSIVQVSIDGRTVRNLDLLPATGRGAPARAGLTAAAPEALGELLERLKARYNLIVVDMPVAGAQAEGLMLGALLDQVIVAAACNDTTVRALVTVARRLQLASPSAAPPSVVLTDAGWR